MCKLLSIVKDTIKSQDLLKKQDKILVAISGGADSVALLVALRLLGYQVIAAHCNFSLRGEESNQDQYFVEQLCEKMNVKLHHITFNTQKYAQDLGISIEMAARELRYDWFRSVSCKYGYDKVALAHHRDDQVETVLLNLSSGTGIRGLCGMPYKRNDLYVRPLLDCSRELILNFLHSLGYTYRTDSSNFDTKYKRNLIRHQLLPLFEKLNPSFRQSVAGNLSVLQFNQDVFEQSIHTIRKQMICDDVLNITILQNYSLSKPHLLYEVLRPYHFSFDVCLNMTTYMEKMDYSGRKTFISDTHHIIVSNQYKWEIIPIEELCQSYHYYIDISFDNYVDVNSGILSWQILSYAKDINLKTNDNEAIYDYDRLLQGLSGVPLLDLRSRREGDFIKPFGMNGCKKKIARILIDRQISHRRRCRQLLLAHRQHALWLIGLKVDSTFCVQKDTSRIIRFLWSPNQ